MEETEKVQPSPNVQEDPSKVSSTEDDSTERSRLRVDSETQTTRSSGNPVTVPVDEPVDLPSPVVDLTDHSPVQFPGSQGSPSIKNVVDAILDGGKIASQLDTVVPTIRGVTNVIPSTVSNVSTGSGGFTVSTTKPTVNVNIKDKPVTAVRNIKSVKSIPDVITTTIPAIDAAIRSGDPREAVEYLIDAVVNSPKAIVTSLSNAGNAVLQDNAQTLVKEVANLSGVSGTVSAVEDVYNLITGAPKSNTWSNEIIETLVPKETTVQDIFKSDLINPVKVVTQAAKGIGNFLRGLF